MRAAGFNGGVHFVENSPTLREAQQQAVPGALWHETIDDLPARPLLLVANEFLDALPIRQHVGGIERRVLVAAGGLAFDRDGDILETSPAREIAVNSIGTCLAAKGGAAIIVDYGHARSGEGDTLQAVRGHRFAPVLANPGEQDLTSHVDFEAVADAAKAAGAAATAVVDQGEWLIRLGIEARAQSLSRANPERAVEVQEALERLTIRNQMGTLFKVIALHSPGWPAPAGFDS
jgi:SAM-dependent MidA family methyltransferase